MVVVVQGLWWLCSGGVCGVLVVVVLLWCSGADVVVVSYWWCSNVGLVVMWWCWW